MSLNHFPLKLAPILALCRKKIEDYYSDKIYLKKESSKSSRKIAKVMQKNDLRS